MALIVPAKLACLEPTHARQNENIVLKSRHQNTIWMFIFRGQLITQPVFIKAPCYCANLDVHIQRTVNNRACLLKLHVTVLIWMFTVSFDCQQQSLFVKAPCYCANLDVHSQLGMSTTEPVCQSSMLLCQSGHSYSENGQQQSLLVRAPCYCTNLNVHSQLGLSTTEPICQSNVLLRYPKKYCSIFNTKKRPHPLLSRVSFTILDIIDYLLCKIFTF